MNRNMVRAALLLVVTLVWVVPVIAAETFPIRDGDKVVFWGDSITDNALYTRTIEKYVRGRYPSLKVDFVNLGWGGDNTSTVKRMDSSWTLFAPRPPPGSSSSHPPPMNPGCARTTRPRNSMRSIRR